MRADTTFRVFSMTKPVTGLAMGTLADQGRWRPDDAIADHLPKLCDLRVAVGFDRRGPGCLPVDKSVARCARCGYTLIHGPGSGG
jgi:CubicO group peptidase (beta-lactamase class C family)